MSDVVTQVQSQLENERSIIALSFELLKVVNSGLPQNCQGNTKELVMMYISMRAERMHQFTQISDELINQISIFRSFNSAMKESFEQANQLSHDGQSQKQQALENKIIKDLKVENNNSDIPVNSTDQDNIPSSSLPYHEISKQQTIIQLQQQQQLQMQYIEKLQQQYKSQSEQILLLQQQQQHQKQFMLLSSQCYQVKQPEIEEQQYQQCQATKNDQEDLNLQDQSEKSRSTFSAILMKQALDQQNIVEEQQQQQQSQQQVNDQEIVKNIMSQQHTKNNSLKKQDKISMEEEEQVEQTEVQSNQTEDYSGQQETNSQNGGSSRSQPQNSSRLVTSQQSRKRSSSSRQNKKNKTCRQYLKDLPVDVQNIIKQAKRNEVASLAKKYNINYSVVKYAALKFEEENLQK